MQIARCVPSAGLYTIILCPDHVYPDLLKYFTTKEKLKVFLKAGPPPPPKKIKILGF